MEFTPTPDRRAGIFAAPVPDPHIEGRGLGLSWVGYGVDHPEAHLGVIVIDAGILRIASVYAVDRRTGRCVEHTRLAPLADIHLASNTCAGASFAVARGFDLRMRHGFDAGIHTLRLRSGNLDADLTMTQDPGRSPPLVASTPIPPTFHVYTHKAPLPVEGSLRVGTTTRALDPRRDLAILDEFRGIVPVPTRWRWGSFGGFDTEGNVVGANLLDGWLPRLRRLQTPSSLPAGPPLGAGSHENALWLGPRLSYLGDVHFEPPRSGPWRVSDAEGRVDLAFSPVGLKSVRGLGPVFRYRQLAGTWRGVVLDDAGARVDVDAPGVLEEGRILE